MPAGLASIGVPVLLVTAAIGLAAGVGGYAFIYAKGYSYLTNDPASGPILMVDAHAGERAERGE